MIIFHDKWLQVWGNLFGLRPGTMTTNFPITLPPVAIWFHLYQAKKIILSDYTVSVRIFQVDSLPFSILLVVSFEGELLVVQQSKAYLLSWLFLFAVFCLLLKLKMLSKMEYSMYACLLDAYIFIWTGKRPAQQVYGLSIICTFLFYQHYTTKKTG